jgi:hypothetical protein
MCDAMGTVSELARLRRRSALLMLGTGIGDFTLSIAPEQKKRNYVRLFLILAVYLGGFAFLMRKQANMPLIVGSVAVMIGAIYAVMASRKIIVFVTTHPKATRTSGFALMILAFLVIPAVIIAFPKTQPDSMWLMGSFLAPFMLGSLLITLPRSAAYQAKIFSGEIQPPKKSSIGFNGLREGIASIGFVFRHWRAFISVAGIWTILHAIVPLAAAQYVAQKSGLIGHFYEPIAAKTNAAVSLAAVLAWVMVDLIAVPVVAVAWHRYVFGGDIPRWGMALPSRGTLFYLYVVWIFSAILGTFDKLIAANAHDLSTLIGPQNARLAIEIAQDWLACSRCGCSAHSHSFCLRQFSRVEGWTSTARSGRRSRLAAHFRWVC